MAEASLPGVCQRQVQGAPPEAAADGIGGLGSPSSDHGGESQESYRPPADALSRQPGLLCGFLDTQQQNVEPEPQLRATHMNTWWKNIPEERKLKDKYPEVGVCGAFSGSSTESGSLGLHTTHHISETLQDDDSEDRSTSCE